MLENLFQTAMIVLRGRVTKKAILIKCQNLTEITKDSTPMMAKTAPERDLAREVKTNSFTLDRHMRLSAE